MAIASRFDEFPSISPVVSVPETRNWGAGLPVLLGSSVTLRELRPSDAHALLAAFGSPEVTRLISPPPPTLEGFEKFISWTRRQREGQQSFAFGITLNNSDTVVGLFQVRALQPGFDIAEVDMIIADHASSPEQGNEDQLPGPGPVVSQAGDVWIMGKHRLLCADARDSAPYAALMCASATLNMKKFSRGVHSGFRQAGHAERELDQTPVSER